MKKIILFSALLVILAGFILAPKFSPDKTSNSKSNPETVAGLSVGSIAPDFNLKNIDGSFVSLENTRAKSKAGIKGYIVIFTCNTCPYAVMYEDRIIELHNKYAPKGWPVLAIQPNDPSLKPGDSFKEMQIRAKEKGFPFVYLLDDGQKVYPAYGASRTPHVFLLDDTRKVRYIGAIDNNPQDAEAATERFVENAISAIEAGNEPKPDFTKAIGCTIKSK